jgi:uncharacterized protein (DUF1330 family)
MKMTTIVALSAAAGIAIGAAAVQTLHAQAKPPGYVVAEIDVSNAEAYTKEFLPIADKAFSSVSNTFVTRGGRNEAIEGAAPPKRVIIRQFDSFETAKAAYTSPAYKEAREVGNKYAKFRVYVVEGVAPK